MKYRSIKLASAPKLIKADVAKEDCLCLSIAGRMSCINEKSKGEVSALQYSQFYW